jgi:hypothetical protein
MLTLFALPKPFKGHFGVIQRNAISQWTRLYPKPQILLFGDEEGTAEIAQEFGLRHIPEVKRNQCGTPLLSDLFAQAHALASYNILCYVNADILLLGDFMKAVKQVASLRKRFLMVGRRTNVELDEPTIYQSPDQEARLVSLALEKGWLANPTWIDYFVFVRGLFETIPAFAIGRPFWDNWMIWRARALKAVVVDVTETILAVHQNHDYSHHAQGKKGAQQGEEARQNGKLAGLGFCTIEDSTHKLTADAILPHSRSLLSSKKQTVRTWWWQFLRITASVRYPIGLRQDRIASLLGKMGVPL